jgi:hypothetical protein
MATVTGLDAAEVERRWVDGHRAYVATLDGVPASYGWVATGDVSLGELDLTFTLPERERYLWDFGTLPAFRGKGMYPRLLGAIRMQEQAEADRLWIIYAPENLPSGVGIGRAGFETVADLSFTPEGQAAVRPVGAFVRARRAAQLLGLPIVGEPLTSCWRCASESGCGCRADGDASCSCHVAPGWPATAAG